MLGLFRAVMPKEDRCFVVVSRQAAVALGTLFGGWRQDHPPYAHAEPLR